MASPSGPPPGLSRPETSESPSKPPSLLPISSLPTLASPAPLRPYSAPWASSLAAGLFPPTFELPLPPSLPQGVLPLGEAVHPAGCLPQPHQTLLYNGTITNLAVFPVPAPSDPWHIAHARVCAHATQACAACSAAFVCCSCRSLRFTPGTPPMASLTPAPRRSRSSSPVLSREVGCASPVLFRTDTGNGSPPPGWDSHGDQHDDDAYARAIAECDTCDNSSCPRGSNEPATWTITVQQFDEGTEEHYDHTYRVCGACNRACKRSFMGLKITSRTFDNSTHPLRPAHMSDPASHAPKPALPLSSTSSTSSPRRDVPGSAAYAREHPADSPNDAVDTHTASASSHLNEPQNAAPPAKADPDDIVALQNALRVLNDRPPTPAAFVATVRVKHDAACSHPVISCSTCSLGLICCACSAICKHTASSCCTSAFCCKCNKLWMPSDAIVPLRLPARRFFGGASSHSSSSPEPDIWTPSPRSSPDEIDDLTARANIPLPASRQESDSSRVPSRASSVDEPVNVAATPLPTPDYSSLLDGSVDGFIHPSFPERAILDPKDKRHFLGRGDLAIASLKLYARRIFSETSHWLTAGHFLVDIFQGVTLNGSRDDFRRFVILVGTQLGYGDLAQSMSESLDVNRKMADEYMRLRDVATTWKQKAKANSKDARDGRKARDELQKARGDITSVLEEREVFINQRNDLLDDIKRLNVELSRVHRDYDQAITDNTDFASKVETLEQDLGLFKDQLNHSKNSLSMAEHHRNKAEFDLEQAIFNLDKAFAEKARDKAFYEARIVALSSSPVPTSQPDAEVPVKATDAERAVLLTRIENLKKELSGRDVELAKLRSEVSLSPDVNTLRAELAEAKAVSARLSGMYEQKSKDFRESELERLSLLGKQILADSEAPKVTPPARPRPVSRRGRQRSRSTGRTDQVEQQADQGKPTPPSSQPFWQDEPLFTKHVAAVTTATMSALPHLPFEAAIASAFTTV